MTRAVRFIQASDFHLERTFSGLSDVPPALRSVLLEAPYLAAQRVFDAAINERADFVLLAGDLLDPGECEPRALVFLSRQLERLGERGIAVYWAGGAADSPDRWPSIMSLPEHVHGFPRGKVERIVHHRGEEPVVAVYGVSGTPRGGISIAKLGKQSEELPSVGLAYGRLDARAVARLKVNYLALGGSHRRRTLHDENRQARYSGSPQGRKPEETNEHGCLLVELDESGEVRARSIATDAVRFVDRKIDLAEDTTREKLQSELKRGMRSLLEAAAGRHLLVRWTIRGSGPLLRSFREGSPREELLTTLRREFGEREPSAWTTGIEIQASDAVADSWFEEETLLGDYLRLLAEHRQADEPLALQSLMPEVPEAEEIRACLEIDDPAARERVLREAAILGADLLRGE